MVVLKVEGASRCSGMDGAALEDVDLFFLDQLANVAEADFVGQTDGSERLDHVVVFGRADSHVDGAVQLGGRAPEIRMRHRLHVEQMLQLVLILRHDANHLVSGISNSNISSFQFSV